MSRSGAEAPAAEGAYWPLKEDTSKSAKIKNFNRKRLTGKACICKYLKNRPRPPPGVEDNQASDPTFERLKRANQLDFDDGGMRVSAPPGIAPAGLVAYSLNKKGRWNLVDRFREKMEQFAPDDEEDNVKVSAFEAEMRPDRRQPDASVRAFHSTHRGKTVHRYPKDKRFATVSGLATLEQSGPKKSRKKRVATFRRAPDRDANDDVNSREGPMEVVYELHVPSKSAALFELAREKEKSIGDADTDDAKPKVRKFDVRAEALKSFEEERKLKLVSGQVGAVDDGQLLSEAQTPVDAEAVQYIGTSGSDSYAIWDYMVDSSDEVKSLAKARKLERAERRKRKKSQTLLLNESEQGEPSDRSEQHLMLEQSFVRRQLSQAFRIGDDSTATAKSTEEDQAGPSTSKQATSTVSQAPVFQPTVTPDFFEMIPLELQILAAGLDSANLKESYGDSYQEVACIPRRFLIDITAEVKKLMPAHLIRPKTQFLCVIETPVLLEDFVQIANDCQEACYCRIWVNGTFSQNVRSTFLEAINPCESHSLNDVLQATAKMIGSFPEDSFDAMDCSPLAPPTTSFSSVAAGALAPVQGSLESLSHQQAMEKALEATQQLPRLQRQLTAVAKFMESGGCGSGSSSSDNGITFARFCSVCCDEIMLGWCLASCQHWFCQDCWRQFLEDRCLLGVTPVTCPEYGCQSTVDFRILTTVLPLPLCQRYARLVQEHLIDTRADQWCRCPNALCRRLVHFEAKPLPELVLTCDCGTAWCRGCGEKAHWPASCQHAKLYVDKLRLNGDDVAPTKKFQKITMVRVKACPHCKTLMEKNCGCNHMSCRCGQAFCWSCCKPWEGQDHYKCNVEGKDGFEEVSLVDVHPFSSVFKETWYRKCVAHHHATDGSRLKVLANATRRIEGGALCPDHRRRGHLLEFYTQAHNLVEYVYVWLCFAKTDRQAIGSITNLADRLHFLLLRTTDIAEEGAVDEISASLPKIQVTLSRLVKLMLTMKKAEYNLVNP